MTVLTFDDLKVKEFQKFKTSLSGSFGGNCACVKRFDGFVTAKPRWNELRLLLFLQEEPPPNQIFHMKFSTFYPNVLFVAQMHRELASKSLSLILRGSGSSAHPPLLCRFPPGHFVFFYCEHFRTNSFDVWSVENLKRQYILRFWSFYRSTITYHITATGVKPCY